MGSCEIGRECREPGSAPTGCQWLRLEGATDHRGCPLDLLQCNYKGCTSHHCFNIHRVTKLLRMKNHGINYVLEVSRLGSSIQCSKTVPKYLFKFRISFKKVKMPIFD